MNAAPQTVVCMKWGTPYGPEYANTLYNMVRRNTARPLRFVCFTDDETGLDPGIETQPLPPIELPATHIRKAWRKIALTQPNLGGLTGNVLYMDLDVVVTDNIDAFFDFAPDATYCISENWTQRGSGIGNTSVVRLTVGAHAHVYERVMADPDVVLGYRNEQILQSEWIADKSYWPAAWCVSFKHSLLPPFPLNYLMTAKLKPDTKVVCFTGYPNPPHARDGVWPEKTWYKRIRKHVRPTPWVAEHWR